VIIFKRCGSLFRRPTTPCARGQSMHAGTHALALLLASAHSLAQDIDIGPIPCSLIYLYQV
jgi:hypothetical protein